ncbi:hypothetical protein V6S06_12450, partial [Aeromonas hydrophila]
WITTTGGARINTMMGYRQQRPKIGLTVCPDLVDHYRLNLLQNSYQEFLSVIIMPNLDVLMHKNCQKKIKFFVTRPQVRLVKS